MDDPGGIILKLILLLLLILVNAFFAMSEIAVISLNDNKIEKMAEDGHKKAKQVVKHRKFEQVSLDHTNRSNPCGIPYFGECIADLCRHDSQGS